MIIASKHSMQCAYRCMSESMIKIDIHRDNRGTMHKPQQSNEIMEHRWYFIIANDSFALFAFEGLTRCDGESYFISPSFTHPFGPTATASAAMLFRLHSHMSCRSYVSSAIAAIATLPIYTSPLCGTTTINNNKQNTQKKRTHNSPKAKAKAKEKRKGTKNTNTCPLVYASSLFQCSFALAMPS